MHGHLCVDKFISVAAVKIYNINQITWVEAHLECQKKSVGPKFQLVQHIKPNLNRGWKEAHGTPGCIPSQSSYLLVQRCENCIQQRPRGCVSLKQGEHGGQPGPSWRWMTGKDEATSFKLTWSTTARMHQRSQCCGMVAHFLRTKHLYVVSCMHRLGIQQQNQAVAFYKLFFLLTWQQIEVEELKFSSIKPRLAGPIWCFDENLRNKSTASHPETSRRMIPIYWCWTFFEQAG